MTCYNLILGIIFLQISLSYGVCNRIIYSVLYEIVVYKLLYHFKQLGAQIFKLLLGFIWLAVIIRSKLCHVPFKANKIYIGYFLLKNNSGLAL